MRSRIDVRAGLAARRNAAVAPGIAGFVFVAIHVVIIGSIVIVLGW